MDPLSLYERSEPDTEAGAPSEDDGSPFALFDSDDGSDDENVSPLERELARKRKVEEQARLKLRKYLWNRGAVPFAGKDVRPLSPRAANLFESDAVPTDAAKPSVMVYSLLEAEHKRVGQTKTPVRSGGAGTTAVDLLTAREIISSREGGAGDAVGVHIPSRCHTKSHRKKKKRREKHTKPKISGSDRRSKREAMSKDDQNTGGAGNILAAGGENGGGIAYTDSSSSSSSSSSSHMEREESEESLSSSSSASVIGLEEMVLREGGVPPLRSHLFYEEDNGVFVDHVKHGAIREHLDGLEAQRLAMEAQQQRRARKWALFYPSRHRRKHAGAQLGGMATDDRENLHTNAPHYARYSRNVLQYGERLNVFVSCFACGASLLALVAVTFSRDKEGVAGYSTLAMLVYTVFPFHVAFNLFVCFFPVLASLASVGWGVARSQTARRGGGADCYGTGAEAAAKAALSGGKGSGDRTLSTKRRRHYMETEGAGAVMRHRRKTFMVAARKDAQQTRGILKTAALLGSGGTTAVSSMTEPKADGGNARMQALPQQQQQQQQQLEPATAHVSFAGGLAPTDPKGDYAFSPALSQRMTYFSYAQRQRPPAPARVSVLPRDSFLPRHTVSTPSASPLRARSASIALPTAESSVTSANSSLEVRRRPTFTAASPIAGEILMSSVDGDAVRSTTAALAGAAVSPPISSPVPALSVHSAATAGGIAASAKVASGGKADFVLQDPDTVLTAPLAADNFVAVSFITLQLSLSRTVFGSRYAPYLHVLFRPRLYCLLATVCLTLVELAVYDERSPPEILVAISAADGRMADTLVAVFAARAALHMVVFVLDVFF